MVWWNLCTKRLLSPSRCVAPNNQSRDWGNLINLIFYAWQVSCVIPHHGVRIHDADAVWVDRKDYYNLLAHHIAWPTTKPIRLVLLCFLAKVREVNTWFELEILHILLHGIRILACTEIHAKRKDSLSLSIVLVGFENVQNSPENYHASVNSTRLVTSFWSSAICCIVSWSFSNSTYRGNEYWCQYAL